jgi:glycosyltransferase involved in cell wall biosynthesis
MKIGIYQEPPEPIMGGSEFVAVILALTLRDLGHAVEIVHHRTDLSPERVRAFFGVDLEGIATRYLPPAGDWLPADVPAYRLGRALRNWEADLSAPYDLFIANTHGVPPFCHAGAGVLHVLFPLFDRPQRWPWNGSPTRGLGRLRGWLRRLCHERWWRQRMESYQLHLAISRFAAKWTAAYWGVEPEVIYPPVDAAPLFLAKANRIAVVGRFTRLKKQFELAEMFWRDCAPRCPDWSLVCAGGLGERAADRAYFEAVRAMAGPDRVTLLPNAARGRLRGELGASKVFWHAMGIDIDERLTPGEIEHFGIATVEAMACGCVPVVANKGGQAEIVAHEECGYLCDSLGEMADRTIRLARDDRLRERMAVAARERARCFSREQFEKGMTALLRPLLN